MNVVTAVGMKVALKPVGPWEDSMNLKRSSFSEHVCEVIHMPHLLPVYFHQVLDCATLLTLPVNVIYNVNFHCL